MTQGNAAIFSRISSCSLTRSWRTFSLSAASIRLFCCRKRLHFQVHLPIEQISNPIRKRTKAIMMIVFPLLQIFRNLIYGSCRIRALIFRPKANPSRSFVDLVPLATFPYNPKSSHHNLTGGSAPPYFAWWAFQKYRPYRIGIRQYPPTFVQKQNLLFLGPHDCPYWLHC